MRHISIIAFILLSVSARAQVHLTEILPDSQQLMIPVTDSLIQAEYYQVYKKLQIPHLFQKADSICYTLYEGGDTSCVPTDLVDSLFTVIYGSGDSTRYVRLGDTIFITYPEMGVPPGDTTYYWVLQVDGTGNDTIVQGEVVNLVAGTNITITQAATNVTFDVPSMDTDVDSLALIGYILHLYEDEKDRTVDLTALKDSIIAIADTCLQSLIVANGIGSDTLFLTYCDGTRKDTVVFYPPVLNDTSVCQVSYAGDTLTLYLCDTSGIIDSLKVDLSVLYDNDTIYQSLTIDTTTALFTLSDDPTATPDTLILPWKDAVRKDFSANYRDSITHYGYVGVNQDTFPIYPLDVSGTDAFNTIQGRFRNTQNGVASIRIERSDSVLFDLMNWSSSFDIRRMDVGGSGDYFLRLDTATHGRTAHYIRHDNEGYFWITDYGDGYHVPTAPDDWQYVLVPKSDGKVLEVPLTVLIDSLQLNGLVDSLAIIGYNGLTNQSPDSIKLGGFLVEDTHIKGQETLDLTTGAGWKMNFDTLDRFNASANRRLELWTTRDQARGGIYNTYGYLILDALVGNQILFRNYTDNLEGTLQIAPDGLEIRYGDTTTANQAVYGSITMTSGHVRIDAENQVELNQVDTNYVMITQDSFGSIKWQDLHNLYAIDYDWIKLIGDTTMITAKFDTLLHDDSLDLYQLAYRPGIVRLGDTMFIKPAYDTSLFPGSYRAAYPAQLQIADRKNATDFHGDLSVYDWRSITKGDWSFRIHNQDNLTDSIPHWYEVGVSSWYRPDPASPGDTTYRQVFRISSQANENAIVLYQDSLRLADYDPASDIDSSITSTQIQALYVPQANGVMKMALLDTINAALSVASSTPDITMFERYNTQDSVALNLNSTVDTAFADLSWLRNSVSGDTLYQGSDYVYDFGVKDISISNDTIFQGSEFIVLPSDADSLGRNGTTGQIVIETSTKAPYSHNVLRMSDSTILYVPGDIRTGSNFNTTSALRLGYNRTSAGSSQVDLFATASPGPGDFGTRMFRASGANGGFNYQNSGTGNINFYTQGNTYLNMVFRGTDGSLAMPEYGIGAFEELEASVGALTYVLFVDADGDIGEIKVDSLEKKMGGPFQPAGSYDNYVNFNVATSGVWRGGVFSDNITPLSAVEGLNFTGTGISVGTSTTTISGESYRTISLTATDQSATNELQNLSYVAATGTMNISSGTGANISTFTGTTRGLVPDDASGFGATYFLNANGTWSIPTGGDGDGIYDGSGTVGGGSSVDATIGATATMNFVHNGSDYITAGYLTGTRGVWIRADNYVKIGDTDAPSEDLTIDNASLQTRLFNETSYSSGVGSRIGLDADGDIHILAQQGASDDIYIQSDLTSGTVDIDAGSGGVDIENFDFNSNTISAGTATLSATSGTLTLQATGTTQDVSITATDDILLNSTDDSQVTCDLFQILGNTVNVQAGSGEMRLASGTELWIGFTSDQHASANLEVSGGAYKNDGTSVWYFTSDRRIKEDINSLVNPYEKIMALNPVTYYHTSKWLTENNLDRKLRTGYIAQEFRDVFPEDVSEGRDGLLSIDVNAVGPYTVAAVQQLIKDKEDLEKRVEKLEQLIKEIRK